MDQDDNARNVIMRANDYKMKEIVIDVCLGVYLLPK